jgi:hypothetical protein
MENEMDTITEVISYLRFQQKIYDFEFQNDRLLCRETGESFLPEDLVINKVYRFEGDSSADDMSVLFYLESKSGIKGILVDAFGIYGNEQLEEFLVKIPAKKQ